jgi:dephospho-CoA kinase
MQRWIVTGPMGAGKSLLTECLVRQGAAQIDADRLGHELLGETEVKEEIAAVFGPEVFEGGQVVRAKLGQRVFGDPAALAKLDQIAHPRLAVRIREAFESLEAAGKASFAVCEAAVYFLLPPVGRIDLTVAVVADRRVRQSRMLAAGQLSEAEVEQRLRAQQSWDRFWSRADVLITNEGSVADLQVAAERLVTVYLGGKK